MSAHSGPLVVVTSPPCGTNTLPVPDDVLEMLSPEQAAAVARIRLKYAQDVAFLTFTALAEVTKVVNEED
jgi:hypothetical protein